MNQRPPRHSGVLLAKATTLVLHASGMLLLCLALFAGLFVYTRAFERLGLPQLIDSDDLEVLASPQGEPRYVAGAQPVPVYADADAQAPVLYLTPRAVVTTVGEGAARSRIEILGWIWAQSLAAADASGLRLRHGLDTENVRAEANGIIIATLTPAATLAPIASSEGAAWVFCRTSGWADHSALTAEKPGRFLSGKYPVFTVTTRLGGETSKRIRIQTVYEQTPLLLLFVSSGVLFVGSLCFRLLRGGKVIGHDVVQQLHTGAGDNVAGDKRE